jgi:hypothetical protein
MRTILTLALCAFVVAPMVQASLAEKETYQEIIDAKPFGDMAKETETDTVALAEQQKQKEEIAQKFRMCGITDMPDGSRKIAFLDETSGAMSSYILGVGETQNGFTLISADYEREYATLSKDGLTFTLGLGKGLIDTPPEVEEEAPAAVETAKPMMATAPKATKPKEEKTAKEGSFRARLLKRRAAQQQAEKNEKEALQQRVAEMEAERAQAARRAQIERIKQGLAPTQPIQLTPEEDAELEAAGVFKSEEERLQAGQNAEREQEQITQ